MCKSRVTLVLWSVGPNQCYFPIEDGPFGPVGDPSVYFTIENGPRNKYDSELLVCKSCRSRVAKVTIYLGFAFA